MSEPACFLNQSIAMGRELFFWNYREYYLTANRLLLG